MRKYIIFRADKGELEKYRSLTETKVGESFYRVANAGSVKSLIWTIAEHYDSSGKPSPAPGYRLTESVIVESAIAPMFPTASTHFRDSGWEVVKVHEYTPEIPAPYGAEFDSICICYCAYKPIENAPLKQYERSPVTLDSFAGDRTAYDRWLESQKQPTEV
ncbi:hypothetical protein [Microcoleus sp. B7-D4]|uniref:hypothetical protein n=1 Tax=Microcoleus sp. B7-D4 TaxID=2818696 RepID=UPI002FD685E8